MAIRTLEAMRKGGLYDHVAGGFHRYTVDPSWNVPHFEKMLYDNALLVPAYVESWQLNQLEDHRSVALDVLAYVQREMTSENGSFYSATDADSEGEEGRFFVWTREGVRAAVGPELADFALTAFGLDSDPNFEATSWVLRRDDDVLKLAEQRAVSAQQVERELGQIRLALLQSRAKREPPLRDDKRLVSWNGLMISAFAIAGTVWSDAELIASAERAADDLLTNATHAGDLARYLKRDPATGETRAHGRALLDDHSFFIAGLLDLFEATGHRKWLEAAIQLQTQQDRRFGDSEAGGYWMTPSDGEALVVREKPSSDGAIPSGNSIAALNLQRLFLLTQDAAYQERSEMTLRAFSELVETSPTVHSILLEALDFALDTPKEIVIITPNDRSQAAAFLAALGKTYLPNRILVVASEAEARKLEALVPLLGQKRALGGKTTAYVCEDRVCEAPTQELGKFLAALESKPESLRNNAVEN
jgi:uncharacterized protein YyaL (SSP411 family)